MGTAAYMSPEQARGKAGRQARRHLGLRRGVLRDAHRPAAISRRDGFRHPGRGARKGAGSECPARPCPLRSGAMFAQGPAQTLASHRRCPARYWKRIRNKFAGACNEAKRTWLPWAIAGALLWLQRSRRSWPGAPLDRRPVPAIFRSSDWMPTLARTRTSARLMPPRSRPSRRTEHGWCIRCAVRMVKQMLASRLLNENRQDVIAGTENGSGPFFSPDGQSIGFFADSKLKRTALNGGAPITLAEASTLGAEAGAKTEPLSLRSPIPVPFPVFPRLEERRNRSPTCGTVRSLIVGRKFYRRQGRSLHSEQKPERVRRRQAGDC